MGCITKLALVEADLQVRMVVFPVRDPSDCVREGHCFVMVGEPESLRNCIVYSLPPWQSDEHAIDFVIDQEFTACHRLARVRQE